MIPSINPYKKQTVFEQLPRFAEFLRKEKLEALLQLQLDLTKPLDIPLLKLFPDFSDEQLIEMGRVGLIEILFALENGSTDEYMDRSIEKWTSNQLPRILKDQVKAEDITLITFVRKQSFLHFLPQYTHSVEQMLQVIRELDEFLVDHETRLINVYIDIYQRSLTEHEKQSEKFRTNQHKIELELTENKDFLEKIADATPTVLFVFDLYQEQIVYINQEITDALGYAPEEIIQKSLPGLLDIYHPEDVQHIPARLEEYNVNGVQQMEYECRLKHKHGHYRWALIREMVFKRNEKGKVTSILGAGLDITDRKEMEEKLFQKTLELQQSNTSLEEFAYVASHDLQEPLRKISTFGDRLMSTQDGNLSKDGKLYLSKIIQSSLHMQRMINDLLSISVISYDKSYEYVSLKMICEEALQLLEHKIEEKKATIELGALPNAMVIPSQFRQLFQNLISNSLKFSKPTMPPVINISHSFLNKAPKGWKSRSLSHKFHQVEISDNGIGFENQFAEKIFIIFQRLHSKHEYHGTGIGLAICKKIVENHGGMITASSELNVGTTFTIIIPA